jgi:hypothetical protein
MFLLSALMFSLSVSSPAASAAASALRSSPNVTVAGEPVIVWQSVDMLHRCGGIIDVPDIPARVFVGGQGEGGGNVTQMVCGSTNYHITEGPSVLEVNRSCTVAWNETGNPDPSQFAGDEFLDSTVAFDNGTVYTLVHTEYPGNVYHNCTGPAYPHCWTVTIGLAVSYDWGHTWVHARPPPNHLVAAVPYGYNQSQLAYGWGDPSNVLLNKKDGLYYAAVWNRNQVGLQAPGVCIMRTGDITDPSSWRAWGGETFNVSFASPYTLAPGTEADHICVVTNLPNCPLGSMVWSNYLGQYVATMDCSLQSGSQFYLATSDDMITWSAAQPLYSGKDLPQNVSKVVTSMTYPAFIDPVEASREGDRNFNSVGQGPLLFWVSIGHSPYSDGRKLWATPMQFN